MSKTKQKKTPLDVALKLLAGKDYSRSEMKTKLANRDYSEEEIDETLDKLQHYNYIVETGHDLSQMESMANEYLRKKNKDANNPSSIKSLEAFLIRKGFDPELVNEYLERLTRFC